ncbi:MAG: hypothetical protein IPK81_19625 [Rhodospirillales bacterium]|nr:MAG: hypothetical protein IPK81_19625 [Rhodospirillales bacterium]
METALLLGAPVLVATWVVIALDWRRGVYGLILFTPFTGFVVAALSPSPIGALVRDVLIVAPLYLGFFLLSGQLRGDRLPFALYAVFGVFALLVLFGMANPNVPNMMVAGIGAKVWLFYIPMLLVGAAMPRTEDELRRVLRLFVVCAWIPWGVGITMFLGATLYDYEATIRFFYGDYALHATQRFGTFQGLGATLFRIPGSFQFNSQYGVFCFFMMFPIFMLLEIETDRRWRTFIWISLTVALMAAFTSGARGNFVFIPLIFVLIQFFRFRAGGLLQGVLGIGGGMAIALAFAGLDGEKIASQTGTLIGNYTDEIAVGGMLDGLSKGGIFGMGVGANTGAARHGQDAAVQALMFEKGTLIENFFAKAMVELGAIGFFIVLACYGLMFLFTLQIRRDLRTTRFKGVAACGVAMVVFVTLTSFKGWALDTDPLNYYYYLTLGFVFALPHIERQTMGAAAPARPAPAAPGLQRRPLIGRPVGFAPRPGSLPRLGPLPPAPRGGSAFDPTPRAEPAPPPGAALDPQPRD